MQLMPCSIAHLHKVFSNFSEALNRKKMVSLLCVQRQMSLPFCCFNLFVSTFSLDILDPHFNKNKTEEKLPGVFGSTFFKKLIS